MLTIEPGQYRHFKGKEYKVFTIGRHTETLEEFTVYQALYHDEKYGEHTIWLRPVAMFFDHIERDGYNGPRFLPIKNDGPYICKDCGKEL